MRSRPSRPPGRAVWHHSQSERRCETAAGDLVVMPGRGGGTVWMIRTVAGRRYDIVPWPESERMREKGRQEHERDDRKDGADA